MRFFKRSVTLWFLFSGFCIASLVFVSLGWRQSNEAVVVVEWKTASELNTAGFNLFRSENKDGPFSQINQNLIPAAPDPLTGGTYSYPDNSVTPGVMYYYQLEDLDYDGGSSRFGPIEVRAQAGGKTEFFMAALMAGLGLVIMVLILFNRRNRVHVSE